MYASLAPESRSLILPRNIPHVSLLEPASSHSLKRSSSLQHCSLLSSLTTEGSIRALTAYEHPADSPNALLARVRTTRVTPRSRPLNVVWRPCQGPSSLLSYQLERHPGRNIELIAILRVAIRWQ